SDCTWKPPWPINSANENRTLWFGTDHNNENTLAWALCARTDPDIRLCLYRSKPPQSNLARLDRLVSRSRRPPYGPRYEYPAVYKAGRTATSGTPAAQNSMPQRRRSKHMQCADSACGLPV